MKITELTIASAFIQEMRRFYVGVLGFAEYEVIGGSDGLAMQVGYSRLTFVPGTSDARYHFAFNIRPDQLEDAASWLQGRGIELIPNSAGQGYMVDFPDWWAKSVYFFDPSGNIVELIARGAIQRAGNAPKFSAAALLGVSEIGIVTDDVKALHAWLETVHGLTSFSRQPLADTFSVMGDDEGLLLLVPPGREWFMGRFGADKHPVGLTLLNNDRVVKLRFG
jgi:catechol 2,3-dioxygenase-like lactoylglutathione lyase family enzyme